METDIDLIRDDLVGNGI